VFVACPTSTEGERIPDKCETRVTARAAREARKAWKARKAERRRREFVSFVRAIRVIGSFSRSHVSRYVDETRIGIACLALQLVR